MENTLEYRIKQSIIFFFEGKGALRQIHSKYIQIHELGITHISFIKKRNETEITVLLECTKPVILTLDNIQDNLEKYLNSSYEENIVIELAQSDLWN